MVKRTNQIDRTRKAIIDAASEMVFGTADPSEITMQNIADTAGVSHRTLYRHFPSRRDLVNAIGAAYDERLEDERTVQVRESFDAWTSSSAGIAEFGALTERDLLRGAIVALTGGDWRTDRDDAYWKLFRDEFPNLDEQTAREDFAVLRSILWTLNTVFMRQRFDLNPGEVASGIDRAVAVLLDGIRTRDAAAKSE
jgi:AcrR family transcriptional regulator